jgi:uncharacterized SAM-dependent methyltransferase
MCLQLLDYNLARYSAFTILEALFDNGLPKSKTTDTLRLLIDTYDTLSYFTNDIRSLDFSPIDIAASVLLHTCANINTNYTKVIRYTLTNVYELKLTMVQNALIVLKR